MAALRTAVNKAKVWAWANQLVNRKLAVSDVIGCSNNLPIVVGLNMKNRRLLPVSPTFNLACQPFFSESTPNQPAANFSYEFNAVPCSNDDRGALYAAEYALEIFSRYTKQIQSIRQVVKARKVLFGWAIYEVAFEGIDYGGHSKIYYALVLHEPLQKMKKLIKCGVVDEQFPYPSWKARHLDTVENSLGTSLEQKDDLHSPTIARIAIVPVAVEDENIYNYALSAVEIHNKSEGNKICLNKVLCASKIEVGEIYFMLLTVKEDTKTYFTMMKALQFKEELIKWNVVDELF